MNKKKKKPGRESGPVKNIGEYLQKIDTFADDISSFIFRGQENGDWPLQSGAERRIQSSRPDITASDLNDYHGLQLIDPAKRNGFHFESGREISDLELLAKLQHFGAATGLLDFTRNPLSALWFACRPSGSHSDADGKVFISNIYDPSTFHPIVNEHEELKQLTCEKAFSSPENNEPPLRYWEPNLGGEADRRILGQGSVFVLGRPGIPAGITNEVEIDGKSKGKILRQLEKIHNISEKTLFTDVHGFATVNHTNSPVILDEKMYLRRGVVHLQQGKYDSAISQLTKAIGLESDYAVAYFARGTAKSKQGKPQEAIEDYDKAIDLKPDYADAYNNRGVAKFELGKPQEAIEDYDEVIFFETKFCWCV